MTRTDAKKPCVAIACGGTGGHLFPGLAVARELRNHGCNIALLVSPKEIDREAAKAASDMEVFTLPAVGLQNRNYFSFACSFIKSLFAAGEIFRRRRPDAVLAMGGFTSAPPVLAGRKVGAKTFLHESNTIPGRANRFLARFVHEAFVGFPETAARLNARKSSVTGTPVRPEFDLKRATAENCRIALGLDSDRTTILVMGGSQGASGINELVLSVLPLRGDYDPAWQWLHLTGRDHFERVKAGYHAHGIKALVKPFFAEMDLALGASTMAVSRAGASSLAEIAAMRLPSLLVPFPSAADNHQYYNALAFENSGAARLMEQKNATPQKVAAILRELAGNHAYRVAMKAALERWHMPRAAEQIAENILKSVMEPQRSTSRTPGLKADSSSRHGLISRATSFGFWMLTLVWALQSGGLHLPIA